MKQILPSAIDPTLNHSKRILNYLRMSGNQHTTRQLASELGFRENEQVKKRVSELVRDGKLKDVGYIMENGYPNRLVRAV